MDDLTFQSKVLAGVESLSGKYSSLQKTVAGLQSQRGAPKAARSFAALFAIRRGDSPPATIEATRDNATAEATATA